MIESRNSFLTNNNSAALPFFALFHPILALRRGRVDPQAWMRSCRRELELPKLQFIHVHKLNRPFNHSHFSSIQRLQNILYPISAVRTVHTSSTMGWFGGDKQPAHAAPEASSDGGFIAPDRTARAQCWEGRDAFFRCLDQHGIIDSVKEDGKAKEACAPELKEFERTCASSWVCI